MNEFPGQGHQPPDDPWTPPVPARPAATPRPAAAPVPVRIIWAAGIRPPDTKGLEKAERDLFVSLESPGPGADQVRGVQYRDFTLSEKAGFVLDSPDLPQIAVGKIWDGINVLLGRPRSPDTLVPARPAHPGTIRVRIIWDAGIRPPDTRGLGPDEAKLFLSLTNIPIGADKVRGVQNDEEWGVQYRDLTLSAGGGFALDSPDLPQIAVDKTAGAINMFLRRAPRPDPDPFPLITKLRPYDEPIFRPTD